MADTVDPVEVAHEILRLVRCDVRAIAQRVAESQELDVEDAERLVNYLRALGSVRGPKLNPEDEDLEKLLEEAAKDPRVRELVLRTTGGPG